MVDVESRAGADSRGTGAAQGLLLVALGLAWNKWAIERMFASDHRIEPAWMLALIGLFQLGCIGLGLRLVRRREVRRPSGLASGLGLAVVSAGVLIGAYVNLSAMDVARSERRDGREWAAMVASENLIGHLVTLIPKLDASVLNLELPDDEGRGLFDEHVLVRDVGVEANPSGDLSLLQLGIRRRAWSLESEARSVAADGLQLWGSLLREIDYFRQAHFYVVSGRFLDRERREYEAELGFSGLAFTTSGEALAVHARQSVRWRSLPGLAGDDEPLWRIAAWRQEELRAEQRDELFFKEVLDEVLPDPEAVARARHSRLEERWGELVELEGDAFDHPDKLFQLFGGTSPGIAVVDLDRDGHDDLFVANGRDNLFLHARGDGSFEDLTVALGLDIEDSNAATFADFDNDGDADLFLGRNKAPSLYLVNEGGRFVDRSNDLVEGHMPWLVSATAAADYDGDGLLDLYVSTYGVSPLAYERRFPEMRNGPFLLGKYLTGADAERLDRHVRGPDNNWIIDAAGPPNVLFRNAGGGRLVEVKDPGARVFRNSFHSTWADYDGDGDPDLYVSNDFAPNNLLRNEGGGLFVDVARESGTTDVGFGMGVSWGDYDRDGRQDLYVSNMYSKAGRRVIGQFARVDERLELMHRGNSLFRNAGAAFEKVSGTSPPALLVEKAGWSWGSQFVDVDGDGFLDIYALSGMITAPPKYETPVDI